MADQTILPVVGFLGSPLWQDAQWAGTTFRWHPQSEAPPIMGLVFDNGEAGRGIFQTWTNDFGHEDLYEELRVTMVEGDFGDARPGYIVHLCADPENSQAHATAEESVLDVNQLAPLFRANKMDHLDKAPPMLEAFKREYAKHHEFLLAPVTKRPDGQLYVDVELGIVKSELHFQTVAGITAELKAQGLDLDVLRDTLRDLLQGPPPQQP